MLTVTMTNTGVVLRDGDTEITVTPENLKEANQASMLLRQASKHIQTIEFEGCNHRFSQPGARDRRPQHAPREDLQEPNGNR